MMTPNPVGAMPPNVRRWHGGPPYGRLHLDIVSRQEVPGSRTARSQTWEEEVVDGFSGEMFRITHGIDCGAGCNCAANAEWLPGRSICGEVGTWVRAVNFGPSEVVDDNKTVPPGTLGKVDYVDDFGMRHVRWQNGCTLGVIPGTDTIEIVLPSKRCTVCGHRCAADDPNDPESYVHDEDGEWGDHTAEVAP